MLRSRLFMLMLAALLIAQSALGTAFHRCHDGMQLVTARDVVVTVGQRDLPPCHDHRETDDTGHNNADIGNKPITAAHGICTCAIAHCAPGLISQFELPSEPAHATSMTLYPSVIPTAPTETLLRPPIGLS